MERKPIAKRGLELCKSWKKKHHESRLHIKKLNESRGYRFINALTTYVMRSRGDQISQYKIELEALKKAKSNNKDEDNNKVQ